LSKKDAKKEKKALKKAVEAEAPVVGSEAGSAEDVGAAVAEARLVKAATAGAKKEKKALKKAVEAEAPVVGSEAGSAEDVGAAVAEARLVKAATAGANKVRLSGAQLAAVTAAIADASTLAEVARLQEALSTGVVPANLLGGDAMEPAAVEAEAGARAEMEAEAAANPTKPKKGKKAKKAVVELEDE
jgi:hypothetical protein